MCKYLEEEGSLLEEVVGNVREDQREDEDSEKSGMDTMYELQDVHGTKIRERLAQRYKLLQRMQAKHCEV